MKKLYYLLIGIIGGILFAFLSWIFLQVFLEFGKVMMENDSQATLFKLLFHLEYKLIGIIFTWVSIYMLILDFIVVIISRSFKKIIKNKERENKTNIFSRYWFNYRTIHISFILITIFITLSITAPYIIMNSFTAIISISILISNLTKKI